MFLARSEISAPYRPRGFPKAESVRAGDHRGEREDLQPVLVTDFVFFEPPGIRGGVMSRSAFDHEPEREPADLRSSANVRHTEAVVKPLPLDQVDREREHSQERSHSREREPVGRYRLSQDELETLRDIGKFRVVRTEDLQRFRYEGNGQTAHRDLESLRAQGLVRRCALLEGGQKSSLVVLTEEGSRFLKSDTGLAHGQTVYAGLVKRREAPHDAAIYRMYQAEAASIRARGGTVRRVVLDYELKRKVYAPLAKDRPRLKAAEFARRQAEVAAENGLEVVKGKIPLPDLRIEYQTRDGELAKVDLELATDHYKASQIAEKARAGFVVYSEGGGTKPEDRELMSEILSL
jgi:hypothetical protein